MKSLPLDTANELLHWHEESKRAAREFKAVVDQKAIAELNVKKMLKEQGQTHFPLPDGRKLVWAVESGEITIED